MILLAHSGYVMLRERQVSATRQHGKRKRDAFDVDHLMQAEEDEYMDADAAEQPVEAVNTRRKHQ